MKKISKIVAVVTLLAFCFVVAGCGAKNYDGNFVGRWQACGSQVDGEVMSEEDMDEMRDHGVNFYFELNGDKTAKMFITNENKTGELAMIANDSEVGSWEAKSATECVLTFHDETIDASLKEGIITLESAGNRMMFERCSPTD